MGHELLTIQEVEAACERSEPISLGNNCHSRMEFPLRRVLYPLGFPMEVCTNSSDVMDATAESWGDFHPLFHTPPIRIQAGVLPGHGIDCPPAPAVRVHQHLFSFIADQENYGLIDMAQSFSGLWLTPQAVSNREYLRHFFLECAVICPIATRFATGIHAACVSWNGIGILLCGDSGAGKSTLAYACARAGWTYTTDDGSYIVHGSDRFLVTGNCHQIRFRTSAASIFPEIEGNTITQRAGHGKPSIEMRSSSLPHMRISQTAEIHHVVFLSRRDTGDATLRPYSKEVVRPFLRQGRFAPNEEMPRHFASIERLLQLEVLQLRYSNLDGAIAKLRELAEAAQP